MRKLLLVAATLGGSLFAVPMLSAATASAAPLPAQEPVAVASGALPRATVLTAATPSLPRVTVRSGDTLWALGVRYHRGWPALAAYNRILNADLIYVGQVLTIPPASYRGSYTPPAPLKVTTSTVPVHDRYNYVPTKQQVSTPVSHTSTYHVPSGSGSGSFTGIWACIAQHESGGVASTNTGNGYYGGLQFTLGTWQANGGSGNPANASAAEQQRVAENVVAASGGSYGAWPNTSRMCGV